VTASSCEIMTLYLMDVCYLQQATAVFHEEHVAVESCIIVNHTTFCVNIVSVEVTNFFKASTF